MRSTYCFRHAAWVELRPLDMHILCVRGTFGCEVSDESVIFVHETGCDCQAVIYRRPSSISDRTHCQIINICHLQIHKKTKSAYPRVSTRLKLRGGNSKCSAQSSQFRATVRSTITKYCSGRCMDKVHSWFYVDACTKILAHWVHHLTYVVLARVLW